MEEKKNKAQEYKNEFLTQQGKKSGNERKAVYITEEHFERLTKLGELYGLNTCHYLKNILDAHFNSTKEVRKELFNDAVQKSLEVI